LPASASFCTPMISALPCTALTRTDFRGAGHGRYSGRNEKWRWKSARVISIHRRGVLRARAWTASGSAEPN